MASFALSLSIEEKTLAPLLHEATRQGISVQNFIRNILREEAEKMENSIIVGEEE